MLAPALSLSSSPSPSSSPSSSTSTPLAAAPPTWTAASVLAALRGEPGRIIDVGHGAVALWSFGPTAPAAPVLLLVHGWPLTGRTWRHLVPLLARTHRVLVIDLPGVGRSTVRRLDDVCVDAHVRAVRAVIDALDVDVVLVGQDSGGAIARMAAADNPRVRGVVVGNTELPDHVPWQVKVYVALVRAGLGGLLTRSMSSRLVRRSPLGIGGCYVDVDASDGEFVDVVVNDLRDPAQAAGHLALARNIDASFTRGLRDVHAHIRCPTLCIWGTDDPFFPLAGARAMLPGFAGGATLAEIPGGKLFVHEDRADAFAAAMAPFLRQVASIESSPAA